MAQLMTDERETVQRAQGGDRAAFTALASHYRAWLLAMAFLRTSDHEAAEDLVQDVLARVWEKLPSLDAPDAFAGWLQRIMTNACHSWHRGQGRWALPLDEIELAVPTFLEPPAVLLTHERQRAVRTALLSLAPANRLALLLHVWSDYSYAEIAQLLNIPLSTVDGRIYRAKQQLRRVLHDQCADLLNEPRPQWRGKEGNP